MRVQIVFFFHVWAISIFIQLSCYLYAEVYEISVCNDKYVCHFAISLFFFFSITLCSLLLQESLEERVQELEQALLAERIAAQRDRATITKLQRQINKVSCDTKYFQTG